MLKISDYPWKVNLQKCQNKSGWRWKIRKYILWNWKQLSPPLIICCYSKRIWSVGRLGSSLLTFSCNLQAPCSDHQCRGNREKVVSDSSTQKHTELSFSMNVVSLKFTKGFQKRDTAALKHAHRVIFMAHTSQSWTVMLRQVEARSELHMYNGLQQQGRMQSQHLKATAAAETTDSWNQQPKVGVNLINAALLAGISSNFAFPS